MPKRLLVYSRTQPARSIMAVVSVITLLAGLFLFTPWHTPLGFVGTASALNWPIIIGGLMNTCASLPGVWAVRRNDPKWLATGAFWLFAWYLFAGLVRMSVYGVTTLMWVPFIIIAAVCAVVYVEQRHLYKFPKTGVHG